MIRELVVSKDKELRGRRAIVATLIGATVTAICAQIAFYLPGNPVPITLQVFSVICCGLLLGSKLGALSQIQYLIAGLMGAPVFAGFTHGPVAFAGPRGGYLIGFVVAAYVCGRVYEMAQEKNRASACIAGLFGICAIYFMGASWLQVWLRFTGQAMAPLKSYLLGVAPFVGVDVAKVALASVLCVSRKK